jgi:hypothetical protein
MITTAPTPPAERRRSRSHLAVLAATGIVVAAGCSGAGDTVTSTAVTPTSTTATSTTSTIAASTIAASTTATSTTATSTTSTSTPVAPGTIAPTTSAPSTAPDAIVQPGQPVSGPGGSDYAHRDWRESSGGEDADAWFVFEPTEPAPATAPVAIVLHGYAEFTGYAQMTELIRHTVRHGTIVIYPRWQVDITDPCPGPYDIEPCIESSVTAIEDALEFLRSDPARVQPQPETASYFGFSFGGVLAANLANRHVELGLPRPTVLFLDDLHDGGLLGLDEPALDDSMEGISTDVLVQCHVGAEGVISEPDSAGASCNSFWPLIDHIPTANKRLVLTLPDSHGTPALSSAHGVCTAPPGAADAYDWNFCWATWDALRAAAADGRSIDEALPIVEHRDVGAWSDGVPIARLQVQTEAPITPG